MENINQCNTKFSTIFQQYYPSMLFYAERLVGQTDAEDVVQDAFVELWKRDEEITDKEHVRAFLFRTVYTRSLNVLKHREITQDYATATQELDMSRAMFYHPENNDVLNNIENKELRIQIETAINELPEKCRQVFILSYLHDMKNKEISDVLGISVKTVEVHIYKALKFLRNRLDYLLWILLIFLINK
jgi:RNA polymerase sigma-70 factor (ECF subfamily)